MSRQTTNKDVVRDLADGVWNRGDLAVIDRYVGPNFVEHNPPMPGLPAGRKGFRQWAMGGRRAFPDCRLDIHQLIAEEDLVALHFTFHGTHRGEVPGLPPPTGRRVAVDGIYTLRLANGRVVERWANEDTLGLLQQLGLAPAPAGA